MSGPTDPDLYRVPGVPGNFQHTEKRSRFLAVAEHTPAVAQAEALISRERRLHHDAAHHCFAWLIGGRERHHDAGEPAGSAGRALLDAIQAAHLCDVTVVVTRYFGGIKLGTGGLKRAYAEAARGALAAAGTQALYRTCQIVVSFAHADTSAVHQAVARHGAQQVGAAYGERVALKLELKASVAAAFRIAIIEATGGRAEVHETTV